MSKPRDLNPPNNDESLNEEWSDVSLEADAEETGINVLEDIKNLIIVMKAVGPYAAPNGESQKLCDLLALTDTVKSDDFTRRFHGSTVYQSQISEMSKVGTKFVENEKEIARQKGLMSAKKVDTADQQLAPKMDDYIKTQNKRYEKTIKKLQNENKKLSKSIDKQVREIVNVRHGLVKLMLKEEKTIPSEKLAILIGNFDHTKEDLRRATIYLPVGNPQIDKNSPARQSVQAFKKWLKQEKNNWPKEARNTYRNLQEQCNAMENSLAKQQKMNKEKLKTCRAILKEKFKQGNSKESSEKLVSHLEIMISLLRERSHLVTGKDYDKNKNALEFYQNARNQVKDVLAFVNKQEQQKDNSVIDHDPALQLRQGLERVKKAVKSENKSDNELFSKLIKNFNDALTMKAKPNVSANAAVHGYLADDVTHPQKTPPSTTPQQRATDNAAATYLAESIRRPDLTDRRIFSCRHHPESYHILELFKRC